MKKMRIAYETWCTNISYYKNDNRHTGKSHCTKMLSRRTIDVSFLSWWSNSQQWWLLCQLYLSDAVLKLILTRIIRTIILISRIASKKMRNITRNRLFNKIYYFCKNVANGKVHKSEIIILYTCILYL